MGGQAGTAVAALLGSVDYSMTITGTTKLAGVIGWPVEHSRSPLLHNHWCASHDIDGAYVPLPVPPGSLDVALRGLQAAGFRGINVTIPHKEDAFRFVDRKTQSALRAGAVNTIVFEDDGTTTGDCTDGKGFLANLHAHGVGNSRHAMILGAGGAARAVAAALLDSGCRITIANRTLQRAIALRDALEGGEVVEWDAWPGQLASCDLLVNATSLGLGGSAGYDWSGSLSGAAPDLIVSDVVYVPLMTPLLQAARMRDLKIVDGLGMLIQQARAGFNAWFGILPQVDDTARALLLHSLNGD